MRDSHPRAGVVMCGINSLFAHIPVETCAQEYAALLTSIRARLEPDSILVLSVMPLRESPVDRATHEMNLNVARLNHLLKSVCAKNQATFINVNQAMTDADGGLTDKFTFDGLHLNNEGYRQLAVVIAGYLPLP